jgi:hypothetical protein
VGFYNELDYIGLNTQNYPTDCEHRSTLRCSNHHCTLARTCARINYPFRTSNSYVPVTACNSLEPCAYYVKTENDNSKKETNDA